MKSGRQLLFRAGALLLVLGIAAAMFVIGRGHTVYFDNRTLESNGQSYEAFHRVEVYVNGERVAKLGKKDRGMAETMGQKFDMTLKVTEEKGKDPESYDVHLNLPYSMDGILINIPALLGGETAEVFLSELEIVVPETEENAEGGDDSLGADGMGADGLGGDGLGGDGLGGDGMAGAGMDDLGGLGAEGPGADGADAGAAAAGAP